MQISFGTTNEYKIREMASILRPLEIPLAITDPIDPEETGQTLEENAQIKVETYGRHVGNALTLNLMQKRGCSGQEARAYLKLSRNWVISEDSALMVPVLNGLPGPWSARFDDCVFDETGRLVAYKPSGRSRNEIDATNNRRVLALMRGIEQPYRAAAFEVCLMVGDIDGNVLFKSFASSMGWILEEEVGTDGFGYDPIFANDRSFGKSWAQIDSMRKNLISHRRKVLQDLMVWLAAQLKA